MTNVHVICGGDSSEREVSLRSGAAVADALCIAGYTVSVLDPRTTDLAKMAACDVAFPVLHGAGGEDGTIQTQLEGQRIPFVGSASEASQLCFDKWQYRQTMTKEGLRVAEGALVTSASYRQHPLLQASFVMKPPTGGSSIDTYIVRNPASAPHSDIIETFQRYPLMLLERLIEGTELTVGVLGEQVLPIIEIIPPSDGEFDYENKYNGKTQELCPPQHVAESLQQQAQALALRAHQATGCRDFSRTDIMLETKTGMLYLLETNTIPGMTNQSLFPKMAATAGIAMPQLVDQLVQLALRRNI
jgi:D-alanine-D-alanine ligase